MGKKKSNGKKKKGGGSTSEESGGGLMVDPARVRFQHSKIRPVFSGCGRSVQGTLDEIRQGKIKPSDLPPIQVIVGPKDDSNNDSDGQWYFSLNNRRLWVLKRCREEGLLPNNQIFVRVRKPKSEQEALRYSLENCALEAKIMIDKAKKSKPETNISQNSKEDNDDERIKNSSDADELLSIQTREKVAINESDSDDDSDDDSSDDSPSPASNRFSALF